MTGASPVLEPVMNATPAARPGPARPAAAGWLPLAALEDMAGRDGVPPGQLAAAQLRRRYCQIGYASTAEASPCAGCGSSCTVLVGGVALHLGCPDPDPAAVAARAALRRPGPLAPQVLGPLKAAGPVTASPFPPGVALRPLPHLLRAARRDGIPGSQCHPGVLRSLYCEITYLVTGEGQPCASCGFWCTTLADGVAVHLGCPDPAPETLWARAEQLRLGRWLYGPRRRAAGGEPQPAAKPAAGGAAAKQRARAGQPARRGKTPAPAEEAGRRWRAAAAVVDVGGIYLPGGDKEPLPGDLAHAGVLGDLPARLNLGWGGGKLPPHAGQLWLTASFLELAGLPVPPPGQPVEEREQLLEDAAGMPFITAAAGAGWQISEASRSRLGHRMRIWRDGNRAGAQLVFIPYISGEVHLLDGDPGPAALAARLDLYARRTGVPYGRSAAYSGHDLLVQLDARRKIVLAGPADPPPARAAGTGLVTFQRAPADAEAGRRFVHSWDTTAAWLAAAKGAELGVGEAVHRARPEFDPKLPGLWRVTPPTWQTWAVPDPFTSRRKRDDGPAWIYTPLLAMAAELLGAEIQPEEAWVWPEHTRYLELWSSELNTARLALAGPPPGYRPEDPDARAVLAALKDTYSGAVTLFGSPQLDADADTGRERHTLFRPDWAHIVVATATARLYRKILQAEEAARGLWPLAIDRDNLLYASDEPDPAKACPAPLRAGNQLGAVKNKGSAVMADAASLLAAGRFSFDQHLTAPGQWDPGRGGPGPTAPDGREGAAWPRRSSTTLTGTRTPAPTGTRSTG